MGATQGADPVPSGDSRIALPGSDVPRAGAPPPPTPTPGRRAQGASPTSLDAHPPHGRPPSPRATAPYNHGAGHCRGAKEGPGPSLPPPGRCGRCISSAAPPPPRAARLPMYIASGPYATPGSATCPKRSRGQSISPCLLHQGLASHSRPYTFGPRVPRARQGHSPGLRAPSPRLRRAGKQGDIPPAAAPTPHSARATCPRPRTLSAPPATGMPATRGRDRHQPSRDREADAATTGPPGRSGCSRPCSTFPYAHIMARHGRERPYAS